MDYDTSPVVASLTLTEVTSAAEPGVSHRSSGSSGRVPYGRRATATTTAGALGGEHSLSERALPRVAHFTMR